MPALALRLSDRQLKVVRAKDKDYVLSDGDGLELRVRSNDSMLWNFNYRKQATKNSINMGLGIYPELSLANANELLAQRIAPKVQRNAQDEAKRAETEHTFENVATKPESSRRPYNSDGNAIILGPGSSSMCAGFSLST